MLIRHSMTLGAVLLCVLGGCSDPARCFGYRYWDRHEPFTDDDLHNGCFIDEDHGWVITHSTGRVFTTTDGGREWREVGRVEPLYLESICFADREHGWICGETNVVFATEDGGETWMEKPVSDDELELGVIYAFDEERVLVAGTDAAKKCSVIRMTDDGGRIWVLSAGGEGARMLTDAAARSESGILLVGGVKAILRSSDDGASWVEATGEIKGVVRGLCFADENAAWAVGHNGLILRSDDGGESWRESTRFTKNRLRDVAFADEWWGCIVGDRNEDPASVWETKDGGETWIPASPGVSEDIHRIVRSPAGIFLIGDGGAFYSGHY